MGAMPSTLSDHAFCSGLVTSARNAVGIKSLDGAAFTCSNCAQEVFG